MRFLESRQIADFSEIHDEGVELVSVTPDEVAPPLDEGISEQVVRLPIQARWTQVAGSASQSVAMLPSSLDDGSLERLALEIDTAVEVLCRLLECKAVGIRMVTLRAPMCPRFHIDHVPCRLLITLAGAGTEWIPSDDVDRVCFADRERSQIPVREGRTVRQLATRSWSLLKGGAWQPGYSGVVHRSPGDRNGRLLLSFDPLFDADAA